LDAKIRRSKWIQEQVTVKIVVRDGVYDGLSSQVLFTSQGLMDIRGSQDGFLVAILLNATSGIT